MKKLIQNIKKYFPIPLLVFLLWAMCPQFLIAQNGDPPPPPTEHGETGNQVPGGGAPVGDGVFLLVIFATAYFGKKNFRRKKNTEDQA